MLTRKDGVEEAQEKKFERQTGITLMTARTRHFTICFALPFALSGIEGIQPAGKYTVEQDERLVEGNSRKSYHRIATFLHLPPATDRDESIRVVPVDSFEFGDLRGRKYMPANQA